MVASWGSSGLPTDWLGIPCPRPETILLCDLALVPDPSLSFPPVKGGRKVKQVPLSAWKPSKEWKNCLDLLALEFLKEKSYSLLVP